MGEWLHVWMSQWAFMVGGVLRLAMIYDISYWISLYIARASYMLV